MLRVACAASDAGALDLGIGRMTTYGSAKQSQSRAVVVAPVRCRGAWAVAALSLLIAACGGGSGGGSGSAAPSTPLPDPRETSIAPRNVTQWTGAAPVEVRSLAPASDGGVWAAGIVTGPYPKPFLRYYGSSAASRCGLDGLAPLAELVTKLEKPQAFAVANSSKGVLIGGLSPTGFFVSRHSEVDCSLDRSYGENGITHLMYPSLATASRAYMTVDGAGKVFVGGTVNGQMAIWRLLPSGSVDLTYGTDGFAAPKVPDNFSVGALAADNEGSLFAGGAVSKVLGFVPAVAKLNPAGALDTSFGGSGVARLPELSKGTGSIWSLVWDGDRLVVAGNTTDGITADAWPGNDSFLAALGTSTGRYIPSFAKNGWSVWDWGFNGSNVVLAMTKNRKGGFTTCGHIIRGAFKQSIALADFDHDGQTDGSIGYGGRRVLEGTEFAGECFAVAQARGGELMVGGTVNASGYIATVD